MSEFNIIEYLSGLTAYVFDKAVLQRIALERGVSAVTDFASLDKKTKDLLRADLYYTAFLSPNTWASSTHAHGSFSQTIGSQQITNEEKERLYNIFMNIYKQYDDEKLSEVESSDGFVHWLDY